MVASVPRYSPSLIFVHSNSFYIRRYFNEMKGNLINQIIDRKIKDIKIE